MPAPRRRRSSASVNLIVSLVFHAVIIGALVFLAAREGLLGKQLKTIAVTMAPKEKPPEPEKPKEPEKPPEPPPQTPTPEPARVPPVQAPPPPIAVAPPPSTVAPPAAPPPAGLPAFSFSDGAKAVESTSDPIALYRGYVEFALRSKWARPEGIADEQFVAEVELSVGPQGEVMSSDWKRGSGHEAWDRSVRQVFEVTKTLGRPPPKNFPQRFLVRFDVAAEADASGLP